jgi:DNA polymerase III, epsilon subunit and related 3''-5'' exonucleases
VPIYPTVTINYDQCVYCVFDLETTGFSRHKHDIIEISAILLDANGVIKDSSDSSTAALFHSLVKPSAPISPVITGITGITNDFLVASAPAFHEVGENFAKFIRKNCRYPSSTEQGWTEYGLKIRFCHCLDCCVGSHVENIYVYA